MTILKETNHTAEFLLNEGNGHISREQITIASGTALEAGTVLGKITTGTSVTATATAGNTGNGTVGAITLGSGAKKGDYALTIIEPAAGAGTFQVEAPDGKVVGAGNVGTVFSKGGLSFTLAAGATDFAAGDAITITVAEGSGKWKAYDADSTDGSQEAAGILYAAVDAADADAQAVAVVRLAEVAEARLIGCDAAAKVSLAALNIIVR